MCTPEPSTRVLRSSTCMLMLLLLTLGTCSLSMALPQDILSPTSPTADAVVTSNLNTPSAVDNSSADVHNDSSKMATTTLASAAEQENSANMSSTNTTTTTSEVDEAALAVAVTSLNYPKPYPGMYTGNWSVTVNASEWTSIVVRVLNLSIDETSDVLFIRAGNQHTFNETGITLTGHLDEVREFRFIGTTEAYIFFQSNTTVGKQSQRGFNLTYAPFGRVKGTTSGETNTTAPPPVRALHLFEVHLLVEQQEQTNATWLKIRELLAESANLYTQTNNMSLTTATVDDVTLRTVHCPESWADRERCVRLRFAIPLASAELDSTPGTDINFDDDDELSSEHLGDMWRSIAAEKLTAHKWYEYEVPDSDYMLLLWSGVGVAVVLVFLLLLYSIWKMDILRDYHRMPGGKVADDQKTILGRAGRSDIDISMFPSPHQIVPSLFPAGDPMGGPGGMQHEYESRPIRFSREDFPTSRYEHDKQHNTLTPNIVNFNEPSHTAIHLSTFSTTDEDVVFNRAGLEAAARQRPSVRLGNNHESMT